MDLAIGQNIKWLRSEKNVTQEQLANYLSSSFQAISKWENGTAVPDTVLLPEIAKYFQVTIDDLFNEHMIGYANMARRLLVVYEISHNQEDFIRVDIEFKKLIDSGRYTEEDLHAYGVLYEYHAGYCTKKAIETYEKVIELIEDKKNNLFYKTHSQLIWFKSRIGKTEENLVRYSQMVQEEPENLYVAGLYIAVLTHVNKYKEAYQSVEKALEKLPNDAKFYLKAGDLCKDMIKPFHIGTRQLNYIIQMQVHYIVKHYAIMN